MKKACVFLIMMGLMLVMPLRVLAAVSINIPQEDGTFAVTENSDGTETRVYNIYASTSAGEEIGKITVEFNYGSAVKDFKCQSGGDFEVSSSDVNQTNNATCIFTVPNGGKNSGENFVIGKMAFTVAKNTPDEDCTVRYSLGGAEGTEQKANPETGAMIPYIALGVGALAAVGIYAVSKRRTSLYKI